MNIEETYERLLKNVENRSWGRCDTLSGEKVAGLTFKGEPAPTTAVIVFSCEVTNKPHIRTVVLGRDSGEDKWEVRSENTVNLPASYPTPTGHLCQTSNTPDEVPSVTPSITLTGKQVDRLRSKLWASVEAIEYGQINKANDEVVAALTHMIGLGDRS